MNLPKDPAMRLSFINMQLRDHYKSLDDLCKSLGYDKQEIVASLKQIDYEYEETNNQFV